MEALVDYDSEDAKKFLSDGERDYRNDRMNAIWIARRKAIHETQRRVYKILAQRPKDVPIRPTHLAELLHGKGCGMTVEEKSAIFTLVEHGICEFTPEWKVKRVKDWDGKDYLW